jgi:hypothetical protein
MIETFGADVVTTVLAHGGAELPGPHTPLGGVASAVFEMLVGAGMTTVPVMTYVTTPPDGNVGIDSAIAPLPFAFAQTAPPVERHVHDVDAMPAGSGSLTCVPSASTAPVFVTVTVQVSVPPPMYDGLFATLSIVICAADAFVTTAVHGGAVLPGRHTPFGGVTLAVLTMLAGGVPDTVAVIV